MKEYQQPCRENTETVGKNKTYRDGKELHSKHKNQDKGVCLYTVPQLRSTVP